MSLKPRPEPEESLRICPTVDNSQLHGWFPARGSPHRQGQSKPYSVGLKDNPSARDPDPDRTLCWMSRAFREDRSTCASEPVCSVVLSWGSEHLPQLRGHRNT